MRRGAQTPVLLAAVLLGAGCLSKGDTNVHATGTVGDTCGKSTF